jgi:hypothetical protein
MGCVLHPIRGSAAGWMELAAKQEFLAAREEDDCHE